VTKWSGLCGRGLPEKAVRGQAGKKIVGEAQERTHRPEARGSTGKGEINKGKTSGASELRGRITSRTHERKIGGRSCTKQAPAPKCSGKGGEVYSSSVQYEKSTWVPNDGGHQPIARAPLGNTQYSDQIDLKQQSRVPYEKKAQKIRPSRVTPTGTRGNVSLTFFSVSFLNYFHEKKRGHRGTGGRRPALEPSCSGKGT